MIVSIEGPDGCGKTQYGKWLAKELGFAWVTQPTDAYPELEYQNMIGHTRHNVISDFASTGADCVIDRGPISMIVYSRVFGREVPDHAWESLRSMNPVILYFTCDPDELSVRHTEDMPYEQIVAEYARVLTEIDEDFEIFMFDTTTNVLDDLNHVSGDIATGEVRM